MFRRSFFSFMGSFLITTLLVICFVPFFLTPEAQNTYYNKQAFLSFQVVNKEKVSFDFQTRRVKFYPSDEMKNSISATSKMTYIARKRNIDLTINSDEIGDNEVVCSFMTPEISVDGNENQAQMLFSDIRVNGKLIQKEIQASAQNPYQYTIHQIPHQTPVSISFRAKKPFSLFDLNLPLTGGLLILLWGLIYYRGSLMKVATYLMKKMESNRLVRGFLNVYQSLFCRFSYLNFCLFLLLFYALFILVCLQTPFHSDDWVQMDYGVGFYKAYHLWMTWSGRVVADTVARALLQLHDYRLLLAMITAAVPIITCALITIIPSKITKQKAEPITFLITLFLYWICNPNLGQTTFWVVGMSNYLWTCMMVLIFWYVYLAGYQKHSWGYCILLILTGLSAGCSNEHTALTLPFILLGAGYLLKRQYPKERTTNTKLAFLSCLLGEIILMGAPGNYVRLKTETETLSFWRKIGKGIERLLRHFISFGYIFALLGISVFLNKSHWKIQREKPQPFWWGILFVFAGCLSAGVMIFSPSASARTFNNSLIFFLLGLSFMIHAFSYQDLKSHLLKFVAFVSCGVIFISSYACVLCSYHATTIQQKIRLSLIEKQQGQKDITIPDFYFPKLRTNNDKFDMYHNVLGMAVHFGFEHIFLNQDVHFDYGVLLTGHKITPQHSVPNTFILAKSSNLVADGTILVGTKNSDIPLERCVLKLKGKEINLSPRLQLADVYVSGVSVYHFDYQKDSVDLFCPLP